MRGVPAVLDHVIADCLATSSRRDILAVLKLRKARAAIAELIAKGEASLALVEARAKVGCCNADERRAMEQHRAALAACKAVQP